MFKKILLGFTIFIFAVVLSNTIISIYYCKTISKILEAPYSKSIEAIKFSLGTYKTKLSDSNARDEDMTTVYFVFITLNDDGLTKDECLEMGTSILPLINDLWTKYSASSNNTIWISLYIGEINDNFGTEDYILYRGPTSEHDLSWTYSITQHHETFPFPNIAQLFSALNFKEYTYYAHNILRPTTVFSSSVFIVCAYTYRSKLVAFAKFLKEKSER